MRFFSFNQHRSCGRGFTLTEIMIVVTVIMILAILGLMAFQKQIERGYDARRKTDLRRIQTAFEDYFNDNDCYPTEDVWNGCYKDGDGADGDGCGKSCAALTPYLEKFLCDPRDNSNYRYIPSECNGYRLYAKLQDLNDPDINRVGCGLLGCGYDLSIAYNYGVAIGSVPVAPVGFVANPPAGSTGPSSINPALFPEGYNVVCMDINDCGMVDPKTMEPAGCGQAFKDDTECRLVGKCCGGKPSYPGCIGEQKPSIICKYPIKSLP